MTLEEARRLVRRRRETPDGIYCPCCGRFSKVYPRKLHCEMVLFLISLSRRSPGWHPMKELVDAKPRETTKDRIYKTDAGYLVHWGLMERRRKGSMCRITARGRQFIRGKIRVPGCAHISNDNVCERLSGKLINVREALADKFDLEELLHG